MNLLSELEDVLREEQESLLNGDFKRLEGLIDRKTRLSEWLKQEKLEVPPQAIQHLSERARQNEALLESARRGLQAAILQIRQPVGPAKQTTYSRSGERSSLSRSPSSITQKF